MSRKKALLSLAYDFDKKESVRNILIWIRRWNRNLQSNKEEGLKFGDPMNIAIRTNTPITALIEEGFVICERIAKLNRISNRLNNAFFLDRFYDYGDVVVSTETALEDLENSEIMAMILDFEGKAHSVGISADTVFERAVY